MVYHLWLDGGSLFSSTDEQIWTVVVDNMALPKDKRKLPTEKTLAVMMWGHGKPKYVDTLLAPLVHEFKIIDPLGPGLPSMI